MLYRKQCRLESFPKIYIDKPLMSIILFSQSLPVMVNFTITLTILRGSQIVERETTATTYMISGWSCQVFLEASSVCTGRVSKEVPPCLCRWAASNPLSARIEQKGGGRLNLLSVWAETSLLSAFKQSCSWFSGLSIWIKIMTPTASLVLWLRGGNPWAFSAFIFVWAYSLI